VLNSSGITERIVNVALSNGRATDTLRVIFVRKH
jgi:hypothetical protein